MRRATPSLTLSSVQFQQVGEHLIHIAFPFRNVGNGENGIDAVVAAGIDGFDKKAVDLKNAEDVSVFDDALREANAVVPHVGRLLIEGQPIESIEFHNGKDVVVQCLYPLRNGIAQGFNRRHIHVYFVVMTPDHRLHLVECPRDAIQGWPHPITTEDKLAYFRTLLRVGFDTLDMGSFVSPKAMPAMADTGKVLAQLEEEGIWGQTDTRALVIVANERGARDAVGFERIYDVLRPRQSAERDDRRRRLDKVVERPLRQGADLASEDEGDARGSGAWSTAQFVLGEVGIVQAPPNCGAGLRHRGRCHRCGWRAGCSVAGVPRLALHCSLWAALC